MFAVCFSDSVFSAPPSCLESLLSVSGGSELSCLTIKNLNQDINLGYQDHCFFVFLT